MVRTVGIGLQDFEKIRKQDIFLVDKTNFIKEWWEAKDDVTLITRPRRFGKTLTLSMVEQLSGHCAEFFQYKRNFLPSGQKEDLQNNPASISEI